MSDRAAAQSSNAGAGVFLAFLFALLRPAMPTPFGLEPAPAWTILCYAFAVPTLAFYGYRRRICWQPTNFDYLLAAYVVCVLATWPTSFNRAATGVAMVRLGAQIAVFYAVRLLVADRPGLTRVVVAALVGGIAILQWTAFDYHLRYGLSERLLDFPPLEWNGRQGLGFAGAIQFALLIGLWQRARSPLLRFASMLLIAGVVVELLFLYSRLAWIAAAAVLGVALVTTIRLGGFRRFALAVGVIIVVVGLVSTPFVLHLARVAAGWEEGMEGGPEVRLAGWIGATHVIRQHVFVGVGLGNYFPVRQSVNWHPHNIFLQQIAEVGIGGGLAYIALWATVLWAGWQIGTRTADTHEISTSLFYGLVAIAMVNMGENMFDIVDERIRLHTMAWILIALVIAEWNRMRLPAPPCLEHAT